MFDLLTDRERTELARRLGRAAHRFLHEWDQLKLAPPAVLKMYCGPTGLASDWLEAGVECARLIRLDLDGAA